MRLRPKHWYCPGTPPIFSVAEAVQREITQSSDFDSGQLEQLDARASQMISIIGQLVSILHSTGSLTDDQVLFLLSSHEQVED